MKKNNISAGDYVKDRETGRTGEVLEVHGESCLVEFEGPMKGELSEETVAASRLERFDMPELDSETVQAVVRGEMEIWTLTHGVDCMLDMRSDAVYMADPSDLLAGIAKVKQDRQAALIWLTQMLYWCDDTCNGNIWPEEGRDSLLSEVDVVLCVRNLLRQAEDAWNDEDMDKFSLKLVDAETVLNSWTKVGTDLSRIGEYPDSMLVWLTMEDDDDSIDGRSQEKQKLFKECLDELCRRGDVKAVTKRGYCFYCGTKIYPQNWKAARDSFVYVYQQTGKAWAANTLGYIYYYGRCNDGVPEYEEAFRWFSIGHAGGIEESTYKLGDMFAGGLGVPKNGGIAYGLYQDVYQDAMNFFLGRGIHGKFADTAIRMGNCYRDGICGSPDPEQAYKYYLQARMALQLRMASGNHFGDESVKARLDEKIRKVREVYTDHAKVLRRDTPFFLYWILDRDHRACRMTWKALKDGKYTLTCTRAPDTANDSDWIMVTFPAGDYCELLRKITVQTGKNTVLTVNGDDKEVVFDDFNYFWYHNKVELLRTGEKVAEIITDSYSFKPVIWKNEDKGKKPHESMWGKRLPDDSKKVWNGQEVDFFPWEKQPLQVPPKHERLLKEYKTICEFQEDYKTKEAREQFVAQLMNYEIDELIELCDSIQGKIYYEKQKKKEKIFEFRKHSEMQDYNDGVPFVAVYDGPGAEKFAEYGDGIGESKTVRLSRKDMKAIKAAIEDNVLFEAKHMEAPYQSCTLDGMSYEFFFAVKGRENELSGFNIEDCRGDYEHCMHSAHAIQALEEIQNILVDEGVPKKYLEL